MKKSPAGEAFFDSVRTLIAQLEGAGLAQAAAELRSGFGCLNGLTDGWALFMESLEKVLDEHWHQLTAEQRGNLKAMLAQVRKTVYRGDYPACLWHRFRRLLFPR